MKLKEAIKVIIDALFKPKIEKKYAPYDIPSPSDIIREDDAREIAKFTAKQLGIDVIIAEVFDSNSMDGLLDFGHSPLLTSDATYINNVEIGDVIVWHDPNYMSGKIIHQVIDINSDQQGVYYKTKGIHNEFEDPWTIRKSMIEFIGLGILW